MSEVVKVPYDIHPFGIGILRENPDIEEKLVYDFDPHTKELTGEIKQPTIHEYQYLVDIPDVNGTINCIIKGREGIEFQRFANHDRLIIPWYEGTWEEKYTPFPWGYKRWPLYNYHILPKKKGKLILENVELTGTSSFYVRLEEKGQSITLQQYTFRPMEFDYDHLKHPRVLVIYAEEVWTLRYTLKFIPKEK